MQIGDLVRVIPSDRRRLLHDRADTIGIIVEEIPNRWLDHGAWVVNFAGELMTLRPFLLELVDESR